MNSLQTKMAISESSWIPLWGNTANLPQSRSAPNRPPAYNRIAEPNRVAGDEQGQTQVQEQGTGVVSDRTGSGQDAVNHAANVGSNIDGGSGDSSNTDTSDQGIADGYYTPATSVDPAAAVPTADPSTTSDLLPTSSTTSSISAATSTSSNNSSSGDGMSAKTKVAIAVPVAVGGAILIAALIVLILFMRRRKQRQQAPPGQGQGQEPGQGQGAVNPPMEMAPAAATGAAMGWDAAIPHHDNSVTSTEPETAPAAAGIGMALTPEHHQSPTSQPLAAGAGGNGRDSHSIRAQSPFDDPIPEHAFDAFSDISRASSQRRGGGGSIRSSVSSMNHGHGHGFHRH